MDKEESVLKELKRRCEETKFGSITVEFKIHEGKITAGEIIKQNIKLG